MSSVASIVAILKARMDDCPVPTTVRRKSVQLFSTTSNRQFHYIGIQLLPGVWQGNRCELFDRYVGEPYFGDLPLLEANRKLATLDSSSNEIALSDLVQQLVSQKLIVPNTITESVLNNLDEIHSVTDNAVVWFDLYVKDMCKAVVFYQTVLAVKLHEMEDPTGNSDMMSSQ